MSPPRSGRNGPKRRTRLSSTRATWCRALRYRLFSKESPRSRWAMASASTFTAWATTSSITAGKKIREFAAVSTAPIVSANVVDDSGGHLVEPYVIRRAGGLEIAVVGALTARLARLLKPGVTGPWKAAPLIPALRPVVAEARARADLVVVLGHLFDDEDERILRELPGVDILISGHNHGGPRGASGDRRTHLRQAARVRPRARPSRHRLRPRSQACRKLPMEANPHRGAHPHSRPGYRIGRRRLGVARLGNRRRAYRRVPRDPCANPA